MKTCDKDTEYEYIAIFLFAIAVGYAVNKNRENIFTDCLEIKNKIFIFASVNLKEQQIFNNKQ